MDGPFLSITAIARNVTRTFTKLPEIAVEMDRDGLFYETDTFFARMVNESEICFVLSHVDEPIEFKIFFQAYIPDCSDAFVTNDITTAALLNTFQKFVGHQRSWTSARSTCFINDSRRQCFCIIISCPKSMMVNATVNVVQTFVVNACHALVLRTTSASDLKHIRRNDFSMKTRVLHVTVLPILFETHANECSNNRL